MIKTSKMLFSILLFILIWWAIQYLTKTPEFILPSPYNVFASIIINKGILFFHSLITFFEIIVGFILGIILGIYTGILFIISKTTRRWLFPFIIFMQAIPIFALAPVLTLWFGY